MISLNLNAANQAEERVKNYLENNVSEVLAAKINNGVRIVKDNKTLINKKSLENFMKYANEEAAKQAEKGARGIYIDDSTVFSWAIHYFEEDSIEGTLYNEDGTEHRSVIKSVAPVKKPTEVTQLKQKNMTLFDLVDTQPDESAKEGTIIKPGANRFAVPEIVEKQEFVQISETLYADTKDGVVYEKEENSDIYDLSNF